MYRSSAILALMLAVAGCGPARELDVTDAWVRMPVVPDRPGAGYFTIAGGATDRTLIAVSSPIARRIEMHETMKHGAGMTMAPIAQLAVPAGARIAFTPGGRHLMLFGMRPAFKAGSVVPLTFAFADGKTVAVTARAIAPGDAAPVTQ